jgi:S1-C subfamily serine protease
MLRKTSIVVISTILIAGLAACNGGLQTAAPTAAAEASPTVEEEKTTANPESGQSNEPSLETASLESLQAEYEKVYNKVLPSVVTIDVTATVEQSLPTLPELPFDFEFPQEDDQSDDTQEYQQSGAGSGFVWDTEGHIITNNHVVEGADIIRVRFADGTSVLADVVGTDSSSDLAVIKVDVPTSELTPIEVADSTQAKIGQVVIAIGNPYRLNGSMSIGIISGLGRSLALDSTTSVTYTIPDVIQTDAAINPGNSGGVLVDIYGRLIGVTTAIESPVRANSGVGYVIPSIVVQKIVPFLIEDGSYQQPYIGITGTDLTAELAEAMDLDTSQRGALVISVNSGTPADKSGLRGSDVTTEIDGQTALIGGDVITAVDGQTIADFEDLTAFLARYANVGQTIEMTILRDGSPQLVSLTLSPRPGENAQTVVETSNEAGDAWLGITGITMNDEIASAMGLDKTPEGILIVEISRGSPADEAGLHGSYKPFDLDGEEIMIGGDIITAVDGTAAAGIGELASVIGTYEAGDEVTLTVMRDGNETEVDVTLAERP